MDAPSWNIIIRRVRERDRERERETEREREREGERERERAVAFRESYSSHLVQHSAHTATLCYNPGIQLLSSSRGISALLAAIDER